MTVRITLCDGFGDLEPADRDWVMETLERVRARAVPRLELENADINVVVAPWAVIPEYGIGGHTWNRSVSQISLDPWSPRFRDAEHRTRLGAVAAHEMHHLARYRNPASGWSPQHGARGSLGKALLNEGLATAFEEEMGFPCPFYALAVEREPLWNLAARALADFDKTDFDYEAWFRGSAGDPAFPRNGGYSLGYSLVRGWFMSTETTPSEELGLHSDEVLAAWRTGRLDI